MSVINSIPLIAAGDDGYQISRSVRLRSSASAYFNRTPGTAGNRKTWTWSGWLKRGTLGTIQYLFFGGTTATNYSGVAFSSDQLYFINIVSSATNININTSAVLRDPSAWYHVVMTVDTTQATGSNGVKIWINGVQQTLTVTSYTQNTDTQINTTVEQSISGSNAGTRTQYFDGYLTEINFIDGQALTPSSFGETDAITGVWKPKKYAGTYGTNGFYLNFSDNSAATATTIGKDNSGNGNNWTPNNISVTSGVTYDSMIDVPTLYADGGNGRGNYAVLNPIDATSGVTDSEANLKWTAGSPYNTVNRATISVSSGKWYWEISPTGTYGNYTWLGVADVTAAITNAGRSTSNAWYYSGFNGNKYNGSAVAYGATFGTGDVIGVALDMDAGTLTFYKNNTSQGAAFSSGLSGKTLSPVLHDGAADASAYVNFGQRPFAYTPPTGFKALNTQNLP